VPIVEIEHHGIGGGFRPAMLALNACCADHARIPDNRPAGPASFETPLRGSSG
jgi:hypothetical protein